MVLDDPAAKTIFDTAPLRAQFPALRVKPTPIFFDNPGGTQVPMGVIEAVGAYYARSNANVGGAFATSQRTDHVIADARQAMADLIGAPDPATIVFGASMTALTFHLARSFGETLRPGDEIVVTNLDHDANVTPWTDLAAQGAVLRSADIHPADGTLDLERFQAALTPGRTRLVAITHASNAIGTIPDVAAVTRLAHEAGALVFVDAVQYVPHGPVNVAALDCDFLACSAYKFFGPHVGVLYGKRAHLEHLTPHKVRPAKDTIPHRWETGTLNHEGIAGVAAAVRYLASVGELWAAPLVQSHIARGETPPRAALLAAMPAIKDYEAQLSRRLLAGLAQIEDITVYGLTDPERIEDRVPTVAFTWPRLSPRATCGYLAEKAGICAWSGNYYALRLMERLNLQESGGAVRIGCAHYNTSEEIDTLLSVLGETPRLGS
ncbi:MAG: cysteine desulfurase-like protein [Cytophagales bacterium]|nr:cysteine desulfurase-like protein [Armatimonadota bacterium]